MPTVISHKRITVLVGLAFTIFLMACGGSKSNPPGPTGDITAPAKISDFRVDSIYQGTVWLSWTATGDDSSQGTATMYDLRYGIDSTTLINNWNNAIAVGGLPAPQASGSEEAFALAGLSADTNFYLALRAADEVGNASPMSDIGSVFWVHPIELIIPDSSTTQCDAVTVPVTSFNLSNIAGLEIHIRYESQQVTYDSATSTFLNNMITNADDTLISVIWADISNLVSIPDGELLMMIHFSNLSGLSPLIFDSETQIVDFSGDPIDVKFTGGSVECTAK